MKPLSLYSIRQCRAEEYDKLIEFIAKFWNRNHVFCRNKKVFGFQHTDASSGEYDFIIAVHNATDEIHGVLGFISSSTYDQEDRQNPKFVSGALWKVRDDIENREIGKIGLALLYDLLKRFPTSTYMTVGLTEVSRRIYDALHFERGVMNHFYIPSEEEKDFRIAKHPALRESDRVEKTVLDIYKIKEILEIPEMFETYYAPPKTPTYVKHRYLKHPFYEYRLLGIYRESKLQTVWVVRDAQALGHSCIRIVDILGNMEEITDIYDEVQKYLQEKQAEYIDCYNCGIEKKVFLNMGFYEVEGETIIPNYFEPFESKNIELQYAFYSTTPVVMFKGDCDQDRPNLLDLE